MVTRTLKAFELTTGENNNIINLTNHLRSTINPPPINLNKIVYNKSFETDVLNFLNIRDSNWVFENDPGYNNYFPSSPNPMNGYGMLQHPELTKWKPYCTFWLHDTNSPHAIKVHGIKSISQTAVLNIFKFRLKQLHCFDYTACLKYPDLLNFQSCLVPLIDSNNGVCSYADKFLIRMLLNFDSAIVVGINHKGPFTPRPNNQLLSFWGWACASGGIQDIPVNGYPYIAGQKRASNCDAEHPITSDGLCTKAESGVGRRLLRNAAG